MKREVIEKAVSGICWQTVAECAVYAPPAPELAPEKEKTMKTRKLLILAAAACLLLGLAVTAAAMGAFDSLIARWENNHILQEPDEELRESDPEYAEHLEERWKMRDEINDIAEKSIKEPQAKQVEGLPGVTLTLLESYYDGRWIVAALQLDCPELETRIILDKNEPGMNALQESHYSVGSQFWESFVADAEQRAMIRQKVENNEPVGFYGQSIFIGDGAWINDERCFLPSSEPDEEGVFILSPYQDVPEEIGLPESAIDQPDVDMMLKVKHSCGYFWIEDGRVYESQTSVDTFPTHFTLKNVTPED